MKHKQIRTVLLSALSAAAIGYAPLASAQLNSGAPQILSTNQTVTPLVPTGATYEPLNPKLADNPEYTVGQAVTTVTSPDKKTLLILTSGYNSNVYTTGANAGQTNPTDSTEWVFVFDISTGKAIQKQALPLPATYNGIAFNPSGTEFYVSGGDSDNVHIFGLTAGLWAESQAPVALGHLAKAVPAIGNSGGLGIATKPEAAGIAVSANGQIVVVANYENDSVTGLTKQNGVWAKYGELDLRPGVIDPTQAGVAGGEFPFWVQIVGNNLAVVSAERDRELDVVSLSATPTVLGRIKVSGNPNKMVLNAAQTRLYVAEDNADVIAVIDATTGSLLEEIKTTAPTSVYANKKKYLGANVNSVTLSPDEGTLYVTNAGENAVAVVRLSDVVGNSYVAGLIPTGFYPNSVSTSADGKTLYIVNGKSATGPNPQYCDTSAATVIPGCTTSNQYDLQLTKAGLQVLPTPSDAELSKLTAQVVKNDHLGYKISATDQAVMDELKLKIKHVIYIIKENRTYDQVLGDLEVGNGDPAETQFPEAITPNFHNIARNFVDFDNFYDVSDVSGDGWPWSTSARTTDTIEKEIPVNYAGRGLDNNSEGTNRNLNVAIGNTTQRVAADPLTNPDPNLLPGTANVAAPDSDDGGQGEGYIWNAALKANKTVRDYGFFIDIVRYNQPAPIGIPETLDPHATNTTVAYSSNPVLSQYTDPFYRGFDNTFPDYYRFQEWDREFKAYEASGTLPNLSLVRIMHDHFGNFSIALNGVNTPETQMADNDYAVGMVVDAVAHSPFKDDTLICVIEDDAQDGGDHVDAHRSNFYMVGPYVKQGFVDSTRYNTVSVLRTIEDILGTGHLNLNDASTPPMADAFDLTQKSWTFSATPSTVLQGTTLPIPASAYSTTSASIKPLHDSAWWAAQTRGMDFSSEDKLDSAKFNHVLWTGTMGNRAYPELRNGANLRVNRQALLAKYRSGELTTTTVDKAATSPAPAATATPDSDK